MNTAITIIAIICSALVAIAIAAIVGFVNLWKIALIKRNNQHNNQENKHYKNTHKSTNQLKKENKDAE